MDFFRALLKSIAKHRLLSGALLLLTIGALCFARFVKSRSEGALSEPIQRGPIIESVYGIGTVTANKIYRIAPGVVNTIREIYVEEGDTVRKGQKLIRSETSTFHSPFDGTVTSLPYKAGENVFPQVPILTLVDLQDRYLVVSMEQQGALRVQKGQKAKISFDTIREQNYDGSVSAVYSNDNNFLARIDIKGLPRRILPGMTADVAMEIDRHDKALLVPIMAIESGKYVWARKGHGIPQKIEIKVGIIDKAFAEVVSGDLREGDRLVIRKDMNR